MAGLHTATQPGSISSGVNMYGIRQKECNTH